MAAERSLRTLFCERYRCAPTQFEAKAFRKCLSPSGALLSVCVHFFYPRFFRADMDLIQALGDATTLPEVDAIAADVNFSLHRGTVLRDWLRMRVSGSRIIRLGVELIPSGQGASQNSQQKRPQSEQRADGLRANGA